MAKGRATESTNKHLKELLPAYLHRVDDLYRERPDLVLAAWPKVVGEPYAPMTYAASFEAGILTVKVRNSTVHSLLSQNEKPRLLEKLKTMFPSVTIRNIIFRIG